MDAFKILARSTNIQKSVPAFDVIDQQIPSAGLTALPNYDAKISERPPSNKERVLSGVKRKRKERLELEGHEKSQQRSSSPRGENCASISVLRGNIKDEESGDLQKTNGKQDSMAYAPMADDECRQILKRHKLRATVLHDKHGSLNGKLGRQEPQEDEGKKKAYAQILPQPLISFDMLQRKYGVSRRFLGNLRAQGYTEPTEVQIGSLPLLLGSEEDLDLAARTTKTSVGSSKSETDVLTIAPTGSGKTLCFMTHLLHGLLADRKSIKKKDSKPSIVHQVKALILVPTHELANQIVNEGRKLALGTGIRLSRLRKGTVLQSGSVDKHGKATVYQEKATHGQNMDELECSNRSVVKADILVSTPLILLHTITADRPSADSLSSVRYLVLDEADVLLDPLFREQTLNIWNACSHKSLRTSLWSATVGSSIESLVQTFVLERRHRLGLRAEHHRIVRLVVGLKDSAIPNVFHHLLYAASEQGKLLALRQLLHPSAPSSGMLSLQPPCLIFTQTIPRAIALHSELLYDIPMEAGGSSRIAVLHSDLSDNARSKIMTGFRKGEIWILITTDLLSRGVDFRGMNGIVNYDLPNTCNSYIHRVGRTGRQGREGGLAVTLYTKEDIPYVKNVVNVIAASGQTASTDFNIKHEDNNTQKWLLNVLPNVSKSVKKSLKNHGVESRTATDRRGNGKKKTKTRISTKSGYDRRLENKRRMTVLGGRWKSSDTASFDDEEWSGIDS